MLKTHNLGIMTATVVVPCLCWGCEDTSPIQRPPQKIHGHLMMHVPSQTVQIGHEGDVPYDEQPTIYVAIEGFYIAQTEVTNAQFAKFLNDASLKPEQAVQLVGYKGNSTRPTQLLYTGSRYRAALGRERFPVSTVTFDGAKAYCEWIDARLPTEAEWMAAMSAGKGSLYPWGDTVDTDQSKAHWGHDWKGYMPTAEIASYPANAYGIYDGLGNVWEWTISVYQAYDGTSSQQDGKVRYVLRGGDWFSQPDEVSLYTRYALEPQVRGLMDGGVGFRCVVDQ